MKILVAVPCGQDIPVQTVKCLLEMYSDIHDVARILHPGSLVYNARNALAINAIEYNCDYLLFIDSDMTFEPNIIDKLVDLDQDIVTGICFKRTPPFTPCIYSTLEPKSYPKNPIADIYEDFPENQLFEVAGCGAALLMIKVDVLKKIVDEKQQLFEPLPGLGEDLSFCYRAKELGYKIYCHSGIVAGHIGQTIVTDSTYKAFKGMNNV